MEDENPQKAKRWIEDVSNGRLGHGLAQLATEGLDVVEAKPGSIRCNFLVPNHLADRDGNWHVSAMASLIDVVSGAALMSSIGILTASVDFNISYFSTARIQEEVEIEGKVLARKGKLSYVMVEVTRRVNGDRIALGKQWMASTSRPTSKL